MFQQTGHYYKSHWNLIDDVFPNLKYGFNLRNFYIYSMPVGDMRYSTAFTLSTFYRIKG